MNVTLKLGEPFWRTAGQREIALTLADGATVADALAALVELHPALAAELVNAEAQPAIFTDDDQAAPESVLRPGARLYVVWPVSGG